ncbi:MAG: DUF4296 domain-containing protein [Chitinophagales bacterium]|nr:DUF4296 domain-containing protein [Chitinophagales bacterium]MDW8274124.1 DUF4296 domain-containing protein [Chitinophagales bacterium]
MLYFLSACRWSSEKIPEHIIPYSKMQNILLDIHLADAIASREAISEDVQKRNTLSLYHSIFEKHQISSKQFQESFNYYLLHPQLLDSMYVNIVIEISKKQAEVESKSYAR